VHCRDERENGKEEKRDKRTAATTQLENEMKMKERMELVKQMKGAWTD
jgi:hypothetical protein